LRTISVEMRNEGRGSLKYKQQEIPCWLVQLLDARELNISTY
jgi:hypothetical protein